MKKLKTFYMSFLSNDETEGQKFLGACIVDGLDFKDAHMNTHLLEINPGGEVLCYEITQIKDKIKPEYKNILLNKKECDEEIYII